MAGAIHSVAGVIHSVAGVVCPVAGARYPVAGVIYTVIEEIQSVPGVLGGLQSVAQVPPKSSVTKALLDYRLAGTVADHSLMCGVMHSQAAIINHISSHTSAYNPCCCTALQVPVDVDVNRYRPAHEVFVDERNSIPYGEGTSRCPCTAINVRHSLSYMKQTVVFHPFLK